MSAPSLGKLVPAFHKAIGSPLDALSRTRVRERLWTKDHRLWRSEPKEFTDRLGCLTVPDQMRLQLQLGQHQAVTVNAIAAALAPARSPQREARVKKRRRRSGR